MPTDELFPAGASMLPTARPILVPAMLILGTNKTDTFLTTLPESYLLIDDGPVIDALDLPADRTIMRFDPAKHRFNPLTRMDHIKARALAQMIYAASPEGTSTLTVRNGKRTLAKFLATAKRLDKFPVPKTDAQKEVKDILNDIFLSPVLERVLLGEPNFSLYSFDGIAIARLDRAALGDFDAFILGNFLIEQYRGPIVIPAFDFYAIPSHIQLVRQRRLTAGLDFLSDLDRRDGQLDKLRNQLLASEQTKPFRYKRVATHTHHACRTSYDDAVTLARYAGLRPDPIREDNPYNAFIDECMA
jgi:hypothetical protein